MKVIQILFVPDVPSLGCSVMALCDDGSIWVRQSSWRAIPTHPESSEFHREWHRIPGPEAQV
jgi:hypothetical protein